MQQFSSKKQLALQNKYKNHHRMSSEINLTKNRSNIQQKIRRQINIKFSKHQRRVQTNKSINISDRRYSSSLIMHNPLAKTSFSLNDAITHKAAYCKTLQPIKTAVKSMKSSRKGINKSYRQNYSSLNQKTFQTKIQEEGNLSEIKSQKNFELIKYSTQKYKDKLQIQPSTINSRNIKFKLLFRQKNLKYKSASQRKISRIDSRILELKHKKVFLQSLIPIQKPKVVPIKPKPKGQIVAKDRIVRMSLNLIKNLQWYFNIYTHNNLVGGHLKQIEGYNTKIKNILMIDQNRAKRLQDFTEIVNLFWSFRDPPQRPEYFGQEDLNLFNTLNYYLVKMQQSNTDKLNNFNRQTYKKSNQNMINLKKSYYKFTNKFGNHESISKINKFIQTRLRFEQDRREQYMQGLQRQGVRLNLIERSRELVLREKQRSMKNSIKNMYK